MGRELVVALATVGSFGVSGANASTGADRLRQRPAQDALRYFESVPNGDFDALLRHLRRPPPSAVERELVIRNLPKEGELTPTQEEASKLDVIRPVLAMHEREHDMELRLITVGGLAFVGLHARTVLLISREALYLLDKDELLAVMAHELGHDYFWNEYEDARQRRDHGLLQELELRCDGIAVITMERLRVDAEHLVSAATKLAQFNQQAFGIPIDPRYVSLDERVRFIRAVARLTGIRLLAK